MHNAQKPNDGKPPMVAAMQWVSRVTTVSLEMVLPALAGVWLDRYWGTTPWITITGAVLGFIVGMSHLLHLANEANAKLKSKPSKSKAGSGEVRTPQQNSKGRRQQ